MLDFEDVTPKRRDAEENKELTVSYGIKKAPTLLDPTENGVAYYDNASEIRKYIESIN